MKKLIIVFIGITVLSYAFCSCSSSEDEYRKTLESGQKKYYSGETMTKEEYNAVKSFNNWKNEQKNKKYNDWDK